MLGSGIRLGPYEIVSSLGAGGMGEVYRARDTRLGRDVAIKILPERLSSSPDFRQRFEREARTISSLQHPHICVLHDIGHDEAAGDFLVMEYLEGETVAERLKRGKLPLPELLKIGVEISDALDKAHRKGLTHRDLKPANIMLTKSGSKLMDFGLAKPTALAGTSSSPGGSAPLLSAAMTVDGPSPASPLTSAGSIIGTIQYMSPEQIEGKEADARSDIFALGATLYEMATGARAFPGKSQISVASAILEKDPEPISKTQPLVPATLDRVVAQCLAKNPDDRFQSALDVGLELKWISESPVGAGSALPREPRGLPYRALPWAAAAIAVLLAAVFAIGYLRLARTPAVRMVSQINPPEKSNFIFGPSEGGAPAISPDGRLLAFVASGPSAAPLWVQRLDQPSAQARPGTDGASYPFWSPDSRFIGFFAGGKLKKIDVSGGPPITLCDAPVGRGGTWSPDGVIVFAPNISGPLYSVSAAGGIPKPATTMDPAQRAINHRWPEFLPDGRHFIYFSWGAEGTGGTYVTSLDGESPRLVVRGDTNAVFAPPDHLLFVEDGTLMAQRFDPASRQLSGEPVPIAEHVRIVAPVLGSVVSASANGILAYQTGTAAVGELVWYDRSGKQLNTVGGQADYVDPRISPDGRRLAVSIDDPVSRRYAIWIFDLARGSKTRLTFSEGNDLSPVWSPDGSQIAFVSNRNGAIHAYVQPADGTGSARPLLENANNTLEVSYSWSSDGKYVCYRRASEGTKGQEIWALPLFGDRKPFPVVQNGYPNVFCAFSPDVKWLSYTSLESGHHEVYAVPFPRGSGKWMVSTQGGSQPLWRQDGKEIFYVSADNKIMAADVKEVGASLEIGAPHALFPVPSSTMLSNRFDVAADGKKFIVVGGSQQAASQPITLVVNWAAGISN